LVLQLKEEIGYSYEDFAKFIDSKLSVINNLVKEKNKMYGGSAMRSGFIGNFSRLNDKVERYQQLIENLYNNKESSFEGIEDTLLDLIGYSLIGLYIQYKKNQ
jgi:hypothetical protein